MRSKRSAHPPAQQEIVPRPNLLNVVPRRRGCRCRARGCRLGITLVELLVAMTLVILMMAVAYPSLTAGLDSVLLQADIDRAGTFFSRARLRADVLQQPVQLTVDPARGELRGISADGQWEESFALNERISVLSPAEKQSMILHPSTPPPQFRLRLGTERGARAGLRINVFTGVPEEWDGAGEGETR